MTSLITKPKGQRKDWPKVVRVGSVAVKVYRMAHKTNASGFSYVVVWHTAEGRQRSPFAVESDALDEAKVKAGQINAGRIEGAEMTRADRDELAAARAICKGRPLLTVLNEWREADNLTGGHVSQAAQAFAVKQGTDKFKRVRVPEAVKLFIAAKNQAGKLGSYVYENKLKPAALAFPDRYLDEVTASEWTKFLAQWGPVTRNDRRKRLVTMCAWARDVGGHLPRGIETEVERTEVAQEPATAIGILTPDQFGKALEWTRANHPQHLAGLVIAGFCGLRRDELQGKGGELRGEVGEDAKRQTWEDIDLAQRHLNVTNAKTNTAAWRLVPLCDAAVEWLSICPGDHKGPVCEAGGMEELRRLLLAAGFELPENCFRHSAITYRIALTGDVARTAEYSGNSVPIINKRYRRPQPKSAGEAWYSIRPKQAAAA